MMVQLAHKDQKEIVEQMEQTEQTEQTERQALKALRVKRATLVSKALRVQEELMALMDAMVRTEQLAHKAHPEQMGLTVEMALAYRQVAQVDSTWRNVTQTIIKLDG